MSFTITPKDLKSRLDKGDKLVLVDVREPWEYALAKLEGSVASPIGNSSTISRQARSQR